jgi:hypothetical protein
MDYLMPTAAQAPRITIILASSEVRDNPLGVRGVGEAGISSGRRRRGSVGKESRRRLEDRIRPPHSRTSARSLRGSANRHWSRS